MSYTPTDTIKDPEVYRELQALAREFEQISVMRTFYTAPYKPRDGFFCLCDGVSWDPIGAGIKQPIWYDAVLAQWFTFAVIDD